VRRTPSSGETPTKFTQAQTTGFTSIALTLPRSDLLVATWNKRLHAASRSVGSRSAARRARLRETSRDV
jgi:hypothetical protein